MISWARILELLHWNRIRGKPTTFPPSAHDIAGVLHTSTATSGQMLKANASGLPVDASNTDVQVSSAVSKAHDQNTDTGTNNGSFVVGVGSVIGRFALLNGTGTKDKLVTLSSSAPNDNRLILLPDADGTVALTSDLHAKQHSITSSTDHTSSATPAQMLKADSNGLPVNATNTDAQVSDAVTKAHSQNTDTGTTADTFTVDSDATTGKIAIMPAAGPANKTLTISNVTLTDNRTIQLPDADGTAALTSQLHSNTNDPTADEKAALAGTGTPSALNKYVTNDDSRLTNSRTPSAHKASHEPGGGDAMTVDAAAGTGSLRTLGTTATSACAGNDARLSDARTPAAHAASHASGAGDSIKIDDLAAGDDNTDLNVSSAKHGLCPKFPNNTTTFLRGDGTYAAPPGGAGLNWATKTADYTASTLDALVVDTTSAAITITLPASPSVGAEVQIVDAVGTFRTNNCTVGRNSSNIQGTAADLVLDVDDTAIRLIYSGAADGWKVFDLDAAGGTVGLPTASRGLIDGLTMSNAADADHDITIAVGVARDSTDAYTLSLATAITKQIDAAWAAGNAGGMDTGAVAVSSWYHLWLIRKDIGGTIDACFSLSATAPTMPAGYTAKRRIGSVRTDGSANIISFMQFNDIFIWNAGGAIADISSVAQSTTRTNYTFTVPTGIRVFPIIHFYATGTTPCLNVQCPDQTDVFPAAGVAFHTDAAAGTGTLQGVIPTNTSAQLALDGASAMTIYANTYGWRDPRGRDAA